VSKSLFISLALLWAVAATAQDPASYQGPDRQERLVAGAKKEGEFVMYTSAQADDIGAVAKAFEQKYGVKVTMWRAGSEKVLQRAVAEARGGRFAVDVIETNGPELEMLQREGLLQRVASPHLADMLPVAVRPHGEWVGTRLNVFALAYNTKKVKKDELPKSYADLADPRWKGRLGVEADDQDWLAGVLAQMGDNGAQVFRDIVKTNGVSVRRGHTLLTQLVASGEVPLALTVYNYKAEQLKNQGAPIDWFVIGKAPARANGVGVARRAPHPNAALLFYEYLLGEGQQYFVTMDYVPSNAKMASPLKGVRIVQSNPARSLDESEKWGALFQQIVVRRR